MESTIDSTDEAIRFLADDAPERRARDEVIIDCQAWSFAFTEEGKKYARENGCKEQVVGSFVDWIASNYPWQFRTDPISSWRKRLESLRAETDHYKAFKRYCDFLRQTEELRRRIEEAAILLDQHIQQEIDRARGK